MKKRILTKRGFTIVEVMVAFVIFAIMAGMVATILTSTMRAKQDNTDLEEEITEQKQVYYGKTQEKVYDDSSTEKLTFNFEGVSPVEINYSIGDPNASDADNLLALEYFVGKVNYDAMKGSKEQSNDDENSGSGSVAGRFQEANIYGSNGINSISVILKKDDSAADKNRYLIAVKAVGDADAQYDMFKQFRLRFPSKVLRIGYCNFQQHDQTFRDVGTATPSGFNVNLSSTQVIRIAASQSSNQSVVGRGYMALFVDLAEPLENKSASLNLYDIFGCCESDQADKSAQADGSYKFTRYIEKTKDEDGNDVEKEHINVFAAIEKEKTTS